MFFSTTQKAARALERAGKQMPYFGVKEVCRLAGINRLKPRAIKKVVASFLVIHPDFVAARFRRNAEWELDPWEDLTLQHRDFIDLCDWEIVKI